MIFMNFLIKRMKYVTEKRICVPPQKILLEINMLGIIKGSSPADACFSLALRVIGNWGLVTY